MKKSLLIFLFIAALVLSACARPDTDVQATIPTPPSIQTNKTPLELLTQAIDNVQSTDTFAIEYGTITTAGEDTTKNLHTQQISPAHPFDWDALYTAVPSFPTNTHLLSDFCALPLRAIPSNDGTIRYELTELTMEDLNTLMYGQPSQALEYGEYAQVICTASIGVDADGCFSRLEFTLELYQPEDQLARTETIFLCVDCAP